MSKPYYILLPTVSIPSNLSNTIPGVLQYTNLNMATILNIQQPHLLHTDKTLNNLGSLTSPTHHKLYIPPHCLFNLLETHHIISYLQTFVCTAPFVYMYEECPSLYLSLIKHFRFCSKFVSYPHNCHSQTKVFLSLGISSWFIFITLFILHVSYYIINICLYVHLLLQAMEVLKQRTLTQSPLDL